MLASINQLVLVSARQSRGADDWDKDDYDVRLGDASGPVVGRIMRHPQASEAKPWFWTITAREQPPSRSIIEVFDALESSCVGLLTVKAKKILTYVISKCVIFGSLIEKE